MDINNILSGGLILSAGLGILYSLKGVPIVLWKKIKERLIYTVKIYDTDQLYWVFEEYLYKKHNRKYRNVEAGYELSRFDHNHSSPKGKTVNYKLSTNTSTFKYDSKYLFLTKIKEKLEFVSDKSNLYSSSFSLSGWRARRHIEKLLGEITQEFNKTLDLDKIDIRVQSYNGWTFSGSRKVKPIDKIVLKPEIRTTIIRDIDKFLTRKDWYYNLGIPYKRSYLFYGPPGTGKTTLGLGIASYVGKSVYYLNLNSMASDSALISSFYEIGSNGLLLIEDIDSTFVGRKNTKDSKISFSCFLNCLDGALSKEGIITIITTNHPETLDPALIRVGRIDLKLEINNPETTQISEYLSLFYEKEIVLSGNFDISMAKIQDICMNNENSDNAIRAILSYNTGPEKDEVGRTTKVINAEKTQKNMV